MGFSFSATGFLATFLDMWQILNLVNIILGINLILIYHRSTRNKTEGKDMLWSCIHHCLNVVKKELEERMSFALIKWIWLLCSWMMVNLWQFETGIYLSIDSQQSVI